MRTPSLYRPKGFTGCLEGFFRSARQRRATILRNNKRLGRRFTHLANINLDAPRHPALINRDFKAFLKELEKRGVTGHWTIEIDRENIVHWHMLFVDFSGSDQHLKDLVTNCIDAVETFPARRVYTDSIRNQRHKLDYVLKVRKAGHGEAFNPLDHATRPKRSTECWDIYARDRVLFRPNTGLAKHGAFGDFWAKGWNEKKWWSLICEETAEVARNYRNPRIRELVDFIHARLGIPLARAKWAFCLNPPRHLLAEPTVPRSLRVSHRPKRRSSGLVGQLFLRRPAAARSACLWMAPASSITPAATFVCSFFPDCRRSAVSSPCLPVEVPCDGVRSRKAVGLNGQRLIGIRIQGQHGPPYRSLGP